MSTPMRRTLIVICSICFVATVYAANWLVNHYGPIRVWPTQLMAPAGVYVVGLAFLLRDTIQRFAGQLLALSLIAAGTLLSVLVSPKLALASGVAFAASEICGLTVFTGLGGNRGGPPRLGAAVVVASLLAAAIDSLLFLWIAFGWEGGVQPFFKGQFVAKVSVLLLAVPFVLLARRKVPANPRLERVAFEQR